MKKIGLIIGLLIITMLSILIINKNKPSVNQIEQIEQIEKEADIYIYYLDGNRYIDAPDCGKYALISISKNKLYIVNWKELKNKQTSYTIETKNISNEVINELLNMIDEALKNDENDQSRSDLGFTYYNVYYNKKHTRLAKLPFSY